MRSDIGNQLKREMLIKLAKKDTDLYPDDKEKRETIFNRYKQYALPVELIRQYPKFFRIYFINLFYFSFELLKLEEAEWIGLKPWEAMVKQKKLEEEKLKKSIVPLKEVFKLETLKKLAEDQIAPEVIAKE